MKLKNFLTSLLLLIILTACGGGGGGGSTTDTSGTTDTSNTAATSSSGTVSVLITDNLTTDYSKAWVTILKVTAVAQDGTEHTLFEDPNGQVFNLLELSGVGSLLNTATLPAGTYNTIRITLNNQITLIEKTTGTTINASFASTGTPYVIDTTGVLTVTAGQNTSFALDFDTQQFNYDPVSGTVTPTVIFKSKNELKNNPLSQTYAKVEGYVQSVDKADTFQLQLKHGGVIVTVTLHPTAIVFDEKTGAYAADTSLLEAQQKVDVYGDYDPDSLTITAVSVKIESAVSSQSGYSSAVYAKAEGLVQSISGTMLTLDVREAKNFIPNASVIEVDISQAFFSKGDLSMLAVGQKIEVKGTWDGSSFVANIIEIEGAKVSSDSDDDNNGNNSSSEPYVEIEGYIQSVKGDMITVSIGKYEHFIPSSNTIDVDVSTAWYKHGNKAWLVPGARVEVKGSWNGSEINATVVEFED